VLIVLDGLNALIAQRGGSSIMQMQGPQPTPPPGTPPVAPPDPAQPPPITEPPRPIPIPRREPPPRPVNDPPPAAISDERYRRCDEIREVRDEIAASDRLRLRGVLAALDLGFRGHRHIDAWPEGAIEALREIVAP